MLHKALLLVCCVASVPLFGAKVDLEKPLFRILSTESVKTECEGKVSTACTTFSNSVMSCTCDFTHGRWSTAVSITSQPNIIVSHQTYLHHEMSHVFDFKVAMNTFAEKVEEQAFQSRETCETFARDAIRVFPQVLRDYRRASMFMRDVMVEGK